MADVPAATVGDYLVCLIAVTGDPVDPLAGLDQRLASRSQLPECNSTETPPPSCTYRRFSVRVMAVYWFPFNAFDGDIINPCEEFVKRFLEIYAEKIWLAQIYANMRENMQRYTAAEKTNLGLSHCDKPK